MTGPVRKRPQATPDDSLTVRIATNQAAVYRVQGDRHHLHIGHLHIDPEAAKTAGMPRPIMHGLCALVWIGGGWFTVLGVLRLAELASEIDRSALVGWEAARRWPAFDGHLTTAAIMLSLALSAGAHAADPRRLEGRFAAPVFPGDEVNVETWKDGEATLFEAAAEDRTVISAGRARFA